MIPDPDLFGFGFDSMVGFVFPLFLKGLSKQRFFNTRGNLQMEENKSIFLLEKRNVQLKSRTLELEPLNRNLQEAIDHAFEMTNLLLNEPLPSETRNGLDIIKQSAETLLTILNDILDFSKIEAGKLTVEEIEFSLGNLVEDHPVNQKVVQSILNKLGFRNYAVGDGAQTLTAHAMFGDMEKCIRVGMNDYTTKPVDCLTLVGKINKLLFEKKKNPRFRSIQ